MHAELSKPDRRRLQQMAADCRAYSRNWRLRFLRELSHGPATEAELWACLGYDNKSCRPSPAARAALSALLADELVRERAELQPVRNVRVEPVMVLELTAGGRVACEPRPEVES